MPTVTWSAEMRPLELCSYGCVGHPRTDRRLDLRQMAVVDRLVCDSRGTCALDHDPSLGPSAPEHDAAAPQASLPTRRVGTGQSDACDLSDLGSAKISVYVLHNRTRFSLSGDDRNHGGCCLDLSLLPPLHWHPLHFRKSVARLQKLSASGIQPGDRD